MSFVVYGFRLRGEKEARYVGQTGSSPEFRLRFLLSQARVMPRPTAFAKWLAEHADQIDAFTILTVGTREEARHREREVVQICLALGHRLFNRHLVPAGLRLPNLREAA